MPFFIIHSLFLDSSYYHHAHWSGGVSMQCTYLEEYVYNTGFNTQRTHSVLNAHTV